jgi:hypothetical protein
MKRSIVLALAIAAMMIASSNLLKAQIETVQRRADIPFAFHVEDREFPAGTYFVGWVGGRLHIQSFDGKQVASVLVLPVESLKTCERSTLQFNSYGQARYLSKIWIAGRNTGHELLRTKSEEELARQSTGKAYAMVGLSAVH